MKKRLSARRRRHRSNQSEGFWEKKHRQDISLDRIRQGVGGGQWVQVPAPATQIQQHRSANGEEKGRPPTQAVRDWTVPKTTSRTTTPENT